MTRSPIGASPAIGPPQAPEDPTSFSIPSDRLDVEKLARVICDEGGGFGGSASSEELAQAIRSFVLGGET